MEHKRSLGIVLHSFPFRDYDQILTVFTKDYGLLKLIIKGGRSRRRGMHALLEPLTEAEFIFKIGKSELFSCYDASLVDLHLPIRQSLNTLKSACALIQAIHRSQLPGLPKPKLYALTKLYLERIQTTKNPDILVSSFYLKVLHYEGLLHLTDQCSVCGNALEERVLVAGQSYCPTHAPFPTESITSSEAALLSLLLSTRSFAEIEMMELRK